MTTPPAINDVSDLLESELVNWLHGNIASLLARHLQLRRTKILKGRLIPPSQGFYDRLYEAEDEGRITAEQSLQLQESDFLLSAQEREPQRLVYLAVEVSRTVDAHDITRARERADALLAATGTKSLGLVIGEFIAQQEQDLARELAVTLIKAPT